jgi:acyl-coenzyme A thioesterase PaaI-like protein
VLALLDRTLRSVPMLSTLGIRAEEVRTGHLVLRLPMSDAVKNAAGSIHNAAIFAVGELAAAVVLGTHPELANLQHLQKSSRVKYYLPANKDVTAHATLTSEMLDKIRSGLPRSAAIEVPVKVLDGKGHDVAEVLTHFAFRSRA